MAPYRLLYAADRSRRAIERFLRTVAAGQRERLIRRTEGLALDPRPAQHRLLTPPVPVEGYEAPHRLRVGDFRIFYDIDEVHRTVVLIGIRRRAEGTCG